MTIKEYTNLKKNDVIYYITTNEENKKVVASGKVLKKYIERYFFNKNILLKLIDFSYDKEVEKSQNIFLYHYDNYGYVTESFNNIYLTKEDAQKRIDEINESNKKLNDCWLPWS